MQTSLQLGSKLLRGFGVMSDDVTFLRQIVRDSMELQAQEALEKTDDQEPNIMKPLEVFTWMFMLGYPCSDSNWSIIDEVTAQNFFMNLTIYMCGNVTICFVPPDILLNLT